MPPAILTLSSGLAAKEVIDGNPAVSIVLPKHWRAPVFPPTWDVQAVVPFTLDETRAPDRGRSNRLLSERIVGFRSPTLQTGGSPMAEISPLRRRMIEDMTVRNLSPATQRSYLNAGAAWRRK